MPRLLTKNRSPPVASSFALLFACSVLSPGARDSKIRIMTATTDLASCAGSGGDKVDVESIARAIKTRTLSDPKPSFF